MPLVSTFMFAGTRCLAAGINCIATGVSPSCLTHASFQEGHSGGSLPVLLLSKSTGTAIFSSSTGAVAGNVLAFFAHSLIQ